MLSDMQRAKSMAESDDTEVGIQSQVVFSRVPNVAEDAPEELSLDSIQPLHVAVRAFERAYIERVMRAVGGGRSRTAKLLGISRKTLWEKLRRSQAQSSE